MCGGIWYGILMVVLNWCVLQSKTSWLANLSTEPPFIACLLLNSLVTWGFESKLREVISSYFFYDWWLRFLLRNTLRWMSLNLSDDNSTLVEVMAWCCRVANDYLSQYSPISLSPHGVTRSQWVNGFPCHSLCSRCHKAVDSAGGCFIQWLVQKIGPLWYRTSLRFISIACMFHNINSVELECWGLLWCQVLSPSISCTI